MAHQQEIKIYRIARTELDTLKAQQWIENLGVPDYPVQSLPSVAGRRCYLSFDKSLNRNLKKTRAELGAYIDNILASGHGSVLEHVSYTYAIEGITRVCTGELNRHRAGVAISEGSMRFIRFDDIPYYLPPSLRKDGEREVKTRLLLQDFFQYVQQRYAELENIWADVLEYGDFSHKKAVTSMMRRIIPMGTCTGGVWTFNLRALRHILTLRCSPAAEEEIRELSFLLLNDIRQAEPHVFGDFDSEGCPKYRKV